LICLAAGDFGVLADLDGRKGERVKQKRKIETLTKERIKHKGQFTLFFILAEIVNSDWFLRFLRVDPISCEFDRV